MSKLSDPLLLLQATLPLVKGGILHVYVHRSYESFDEVDLWRIYCKTRNTDITDVVCFSSWKTKYFHGRSELRNRYSRTYLTRCCYRCF